MAAAEQLTIFRNALASLSCQCCLRVVAIRCRAGSTKLGIEVESGALTEAELRRGAEPFSVIQRDYAEPPAGWRR